MMLKTSKQQPFELNSINEMFLKEIDFKIDQLIADYVIHSVAPSSPALVQYISTCHKYPESIYLFKCGEFPFFRSLTFNQKEIFNNCVKVDQVR